MITFASPAVVVDVLEGIRDVNAPRTSDPSAKPYGRSCWAAINLQAGHDRGNRFVARLPAISK
jgi:hypothetical protein